MAERRKGANKSKKKESMEEDKPSKLDFEVLKYLRNNLPEKRTMLLGHKVDYFISEKAIDLLLDSKWAVKQVGESNALFTTRNSIVDFMERLLRLKQFHRAKVVVVQKVDKKKKGDDESAADEPTKKSKKSKETIDGTEADKKEEKADKKKEKKGRKKIKLDMHMEQIFVDGKESYVWLYDPIPLKTWFIGLGMVVGAILVCLFPLWPQVVRKYVYYLSVAAAGCLFFIIALALLRYVFFVLVWAATFGKHHFWMLPNLTEDVGFFASFWPLYTHEYRGDEESNEESSKEDKGIKEKKVGKKSKSEKHPTEEVAEAMTATEPAVQPGKDQAVGTDKQDQPANNSSDEDNSSEASGSTSTNKSFEILDSKDLIETSGPSAKADET